MAITPRAQMFETLSTSPPDEAPYWWRTSGHDLAKMLEEANYPEEAQRNFLTFYRDHIIPLLGNPPDKTTSTKSGIGRDGNPFEYSFELKSSSQRQGVRFVVDLTELRPANTASPLSITNSQKLVDVLAQKTPGFDDTWYRALKERFVYSSRSPSEQQALITKAGQQSSVVVGFDIHSRTTNSLELPVMGKVYFLPCLVAAAEGITSWQAARSAVQQLPRVDSYPNILKSLQMIDDYLSDKPEAWQMGTRFLATDLVHPDKARLKVYLRCFGTTFDEIWDYYTLGGRIPNLDDDKQQFRDLMDMVSGTTYAETRNQSQMDMSRYTSTSQKLTAIYFSLSADKPYPGPKLCVYPANFSPNDELIARGLDAWLDKYGWNQDGKSIEGKVKSVLTHRKLEEKTGIFTFIGIGRKEDPTKKELSMQVYVSPELYDNPRC